MPGINPKLEIEFANPAHGWIDLRIGIGEQIISTHVSDVPCSSLDDLVAALISLLSGSKQEIVEWSLEPDFMIWTFNSEYDTLSLLVTMPPSYNVPDLVFKDARIKLVHRIYKGLRDLQADPVWQKKDALQTIWSREFPTRAIEILKKSLDDSKRDAER